MKTIRSLMYLVAASGALSLSSQSWAESEAPAADAPAVVAITPEAAHAAEYTAITRCQICHGAQGHSKSPIYPALAGQKAWYIVEQLHAFKAQTRGDPYARGMMWGMAAQLSDSEIDGLADYFSKQTPFVSKPSPFSGGAKASAAVARGKTIYSEGDSTIGIAPCSACHQGDAAGNEQFPRLAGQHASYLNKQLIALHNGSREQVVMNGIASVLKPDDMNALALYMEQIR